MGLVSHVKQILGKLVTFCGSQFVKYGLYLRFFWDPPKSIFYNNVTNDRTDLPKILQLLGKIKTDKLNIVIAGLHYGETAEEYLNFLPNSLLIGYEPNPVSLSVAKDNLAKFGTRVTFRNLALLDNKARLPLNLYLDSGADSLLQSKTDTALDSIQVDSSTLDIELRNFSSIDILQIDCQGSERQIILGMEESMMKDRIKCIKIEGLMDEFYVGQSSFWELASMLQHRFKFCGFSSMKFAEGQKCNLEWVDAIFIRKDIVCAM